MIDFQQNILYIVVSILCTICTIYLTKRYQNKFICSHQHNYIIGNNFDIRLPPSALTPYAIYSTHYDNYNVDFFPYYLQITLINDSQYSITCSEISVDLHILQDHLLGKQYITGCNKQYEIQGHKIINPKKCDTFIVAKLCDIQNGIINCTFKIKLPTSIGKRGKLYFVSLTFSKEELSKMKPQNYQLYFTELINMDIKTDKFKIGN